MHNDSANLSPWQFLVMPLWICAAGPLEFESPLEIVLYPDPRLRAKNKLVNVFDEKLKQLVKEMLEIMYK